MPRSVHIWLLGVICLICLMVWVGGATRLTESGLSITEWKPLLGILPPLSHEAWVQEFEKYKQIPQYARVFPDMDLSGFQSIFYWEWAHRLLARIIGFVFLVPFLWFWARGILSFSLRWSLSGVFALGILQGGVGWWMVASGLVNRTEVAPERLAIHLLLACFTLIAIVAVLGAHRSHTSSSPLPPAMRLSSFCFLALLILQMGMGALVAGSRAGWSYNTWPLMDGKWIPPLSDLFILSPIWRNFFENVLLIQFLHRSMAYGILFFALFFSCQATLYGRGREALAILFICLLQIGIGILTLILVIPIHLGLLHQGIGLALLLILAFYAFQAPLLPLEQKRILEA